MPSDPPSREVLLIVDDPGWLPLITRVLDEHHIAHETSVLAVQPPRPVVLVHPADAERARQALSLGIRGLDFPWTFDEDDEETPESDVQGPGSGRAPIREITVTSAMVLFHLLILVALGLDPGPERLARAGGLVTARAVTEPWRLVTSLFLHADLSHVLWNGLALLVFGVPVVERYGIRRAAGIYLASGIVGSLAALVTLSPRSVVVGSSGAVAGMFGVWLVHGLEAARRQGWSRRAWIRVLGIGALVLPSMLTPFTAEGEPVSVGAHVGGFLCGALYAAVRGDGGGAPEAARTPGG